MLRCPHCRYQFSSLSLEEDEVLCPRCGQDVLGTAEEPTSTGAIPARGETTTLDGQSGPLEERLKSTDLPPTVDPSLSSVAGTLDVSLPDLPATQDVISPQEAIAQTNPDTFDFSLDAGPDKTIALSADELAAVTADESALENVAATVGLSPDQEPRVDDPTQATFALPEAIHADDQSYAATVNLDRSVGEQEASQPTFVSEDLSDAEQSGATLVSELVISAEEARTIESNFGDSAGAHPLQTIKSRGEAGTVPNTVLGNPQDTVPFRALGTVGERPAPRHRPEYELVKVLGEGGMGVVWSARQTSVDRDVAVKMIKGPLAEKETQRQKFLAEAIVTGDLDHPNIVPIYDVGRDDRGTLFYSMKQVHGTPWHKVIRQKSQTENIDILLRTCDAMTFAHARGIIHRDLKPENIMLGEFGEVLVMDWGLALVQGNLEKAKRLRQSTSMGGTPAYMAPEMATGPIDRISPASDIYLLGAILWEIITGKPPHPGRKVQECLFAAMRNVITPTEKTGELVDIAIKAMATLPAHRYQTVREFQQAVRGYLSHAESIAMATRASEDLAQAKQSDQYAHYAKAVFGYEEAVVLWGGNQGAAQGIHTARLAYAESAFRKGDLDLATSLLNPAQSTHTALLSEVQAAIQERSSRQMRLKWARRTMAALVAAIMLIVSVAFFWIRGERNEALRQERIAVQQRGIAEQAADDLKVALVDVQKQRDEAERQRVIAEQQKLAAEQARTEENKQRKVAEQKTVEAQQQRVIAEKQTKVAEEQKSVAVANEKLAKANEAEAIKQRMAAQTQEKLAKQQEQLAIKNAAEAVRQQGIAETNAQEAQRQQKLAEAATEAEIYEAYGARIGLAAAKIKENSFDVATQLLDSSPVELRNWEWGRLKHLCSQASLSVPAEAPVDGLAISPDGTRFVMASWDHKARVVDLATGTVQRELSQPGLYVHAAAWSPDGKVIATAGSDADGRIRLWNPDNGEELARVNGHADAVVSVRFSPNGRWLLTTSYDNTARLWDLTDITHPQEAAVLDGHTWWVWGGAFSPDFDPTQSAVPSTLVTVSQDGKALVWEVTSQTSTAATAETVSVASGSSLRATQQAVFTEHQGPVYTVDINPAGLIATGGYDQRILLWKATDVPQVSLDELLQDQRKPMPFTELRGHVGPVESVAFSKSGHLLVSGSRDNSLTVWDVPTAQAFKTFRGHSSAVRAAQLTPDETRLVSAGQDNQALIWNIADYAEVRVLQGRVLEGHADAVLSARFSPDGSHIVTAGRDRIAITWNAQTGQQEHQFSEGHEYLASRALVAPAGEQLVTAAADNTVRIWNMATGTQQSALRGTGTNAVLALSTNGDWLLTGDETSGARLYRWTAVLEHTETESAPPEFRRVEGHNGPVTVGCFVPGDSDRVVTCDTNGRCLLSEPATGKVVWNVKHHTARITAAVITPDGRHLLTSSHDHTVCLCDLASGQELSSIPVGAPVSGMALTADGKQLLTVSAVPEALVPNTSRLMWWDLTTGKSLAQIDTTEFAIASVAMAPEPGLALVTASDNTVRYLRLEGTELRLSEPVLDFFKLRGIVWSAAFTPDGKSWLTVGGNEARLWDATTRREQMSFSPHGAVAAASYSPDGTKLVTGSWDNSAKIWDTQTGAALRKLLQGHSGFINSAEFSPNGRLVLTASDDGTAVLWDVESGAVVRKLQGHEDRVRSARFDPTGTRILTTSNDKTARLWNAETGEQLQVLSGHEWAVLSGAFSRDGRRLVTGSEDNTARLWNALTGELLTTYAGHTAAITGVDFCADGGRVVTASRDTTAKLWDATPGHVGKEILTLASHAQEITGISVSPDGRQILTSSRDGKAIVWLATPWKPLLADSPPTNGD